MFVFPTRLFRPTSLRIRLVGAAMPGPRSVSGDAQFADMGGGGRWIADFGEAHLWEREEVLAWRRVAAAADGGAQAMLVPLADRRHQPLTNPLITPDSFGLETWVDDPDDWTADQVIATVTADAALGATELTFDFGAPLSLLGGEHFSINHPSWGWRLYAVTRVKSGGSGLGTSTVVDFRPPLREAIDAADDVPLNFDSPRCLMRSVGEIDATLEMLKFGKATAQFEEAGKPDAA
jgi:hypothetical protein